MAARLLLVCFCVRTSAYTVPLAASRPVDALQVCSLLRVGDGQLLDLGKALESPDSRTLIVLGTYPADFNMVRACVCLSIACRCSHPLSSDV